MAFLLERNRAPTRPRMSTGYWLCDWVSVSVSAAACSGLGVAPAMVAEPFADAPAGIEQDVANDLKSNRSQI